jgi:L-threonylcarbamoyladenylate synthase
MSARVLAVDPAQPDVAVVEEAARAIRTGRLVAFPTETVYGLGANALDAAAVERIFAAKGRPATDPLIVHIADASQLEQCASHVPPTARRLAGAVWPGPLTLILPKTPAIPDVVTAGLKTVAVRVPGHPVARAIIARAGVPVAAPSANPFARPSPTRAAHVAADLGDRVDLIVDGGPTAIGVESTIVDCTCDPPVVRRPGGVALETLRQIDPGLRVELDHRTAEQPQPAPGQLAQHYAPRTPLTLYVGEAARVVALLAKDARTLVADGERVGILAPEEDLSALAAELAASAAGRIETRRYGARARPEHAAQELFAAMRELDESGVNVILATAVEEGGLGLAIRDRLVRAAAGRIRTA